MQQFQFEYRDAETLAKDLAGIREWCKSNTAYKMLFHVYAECIDQKRIVGICDQIKKELPQSEYVGCSSNGSIVEGHLSTSDIVIVCTIFESKSSQLKVLQYDLSEETAIGVANSLIAEVDALPWVKAVELLVTIRGMSMTRFCDQLQHVREGVHIYGGGAFNPDINDDYACVYSSTGSCSNNSVVFVLYGGDDLRVETMYVTGWKPLGRAFQVTRAKGSTLYELDGCPAYEAYYKYLNIKNDEHFFRNTLEFPFFYQHNGINILRAPTRSNQDGSLTMTSDMEENVCAKIAYGDPRTILDSVRADGQTFKEFHPQVFQIFSCAARRAFWGHHEISKETLPFQSMASTSGFYTSGEFLRTGRFVNQHNVTLVVAAMREGEPSASEVTNFEMMEENFSGKVSMISRLATFIEAATAELSAANKKLEMMAVSDGLTLLYNRAEIQRRIRAQMELGLEEFSLVMIDIDNFKFVNDTYGHKEGDNVIRGIANQIRAAIIDLAPRASAGRWGGEEFMILLPGFKIEAAEKFAEYVRKNFAYSTFPSVGQGTVSLGVAEWKENDSPDSLYVRVDGALYSAKRSGKNKVVVA